ncbi:hypothetical protein JSO59_000720 [Riemerella anatipestifer]|uniref:hypothetical protein n=1 Tax=Riemerella anatipestifer TaxID=34085 RepID=UPI0030EE714F
MEIPFYTSFKEFKDNYKTDLEKWLSIYPDGDEMDYLGCVYERYSDYAVTGIDEPYYKDETFWVEVKPNKVPKYYWNLQGKYCADEEGSVFESLSFIQIFEVINKRCGNTDFPDGISFVNKQVNGYSKMDLLQHISDCIVDTEKRYSPNGINDNYIIPYDLDILFEDYIELIEIKTPMGLTINKTKYNNFKLSVPKIYKFISDRRKEINGVQTTDEVTPTAEEQHTTGEIIPLKGKPPYDLSDDFKDQPTTQEGSKGYEKIKVKGSLQSIGYIFSELIDKGWIIPPKRNGKINKTAVARLILEHFELIDRKKPITEEYVRRTISTKKIDSGFNKDKMDRFKIPSEKSINSK